MLLKRGGKVPGLSRAADRDQAAYSGRGDGLVDTVPSVAPSATLDFK